MPFTLYESGTKFSNIINVLSGFNAFGVRTTTEPDSYLAGPKSALLWRHCTHTRSPKRISPMETARVRERERNSPLVWHEWISYCVLWILCLFILSLAMAAVCFVVQAAAPFPMPLPLFTSSLVCSSFKKSLFSVLVFSSSMLSLRCFPKNTHHHSLRAYNRDGTTHVLTLPKHKRNSRIIDDTKYKQLITSCYQAQSVS